VVRLTRRRWSRRSPADTPLTRVLSAELAHRGLFTYHGNYYALGTMTALGLEPSGGAVRAGCLHYTTLEETDRLCDVLASLAKSPY